MDWYEHTLQHQFTASMAQLRQVKKPLGQRIQEKMMDGVMKVFIPFAERLRQHRGLVAMMQGLGDEFMSLPSGLRLLVMVFAGWCAGLGFGVFFGFLIP